MGDDRRQPSDVGHDTPDSEVAAPAVAAHPPVRVGDVVKYHGSYGPRQGEVLEISDDRLLLVRREAPASGAWTSRDGGVRTILRERVYEVVGR